MRHFYSLGLIVCSLVATAAFAGDAVSLSNSWVRATAPSQEVGAAYMDIKSPANATLIRVTTPVADSVEIHSMTTKNGVMQMRMLEEMALPAGKTVSLAPGGFHLMLIDLKKPLKAGEAVSFSLSIKDAKGKVTTQSANVPVKTGQD